MFIKIEQMKIELKQTFRCTETSLLDREMESYVENVGSRNSGFFGIIHIVIYKLYTTLMPFHYVLHGVLMHKMDGETASTPHPPPNNIDS